MGLFSTWDAKSMSLFVTLMSHTSIAEMQMLLQTLLMYTEQTLPVLFQMEQVPSSK